MKQITVLAKRSEKIIRDNSPVILTAIGVAGTVTTAYLAGKASFKAAEILRDEQNITPWEKTKLVWTLYLPAMAVGTLTCLSIVGANRIGTRRAAAMASAYAISERAFSEYREKIVEKIGENKEQKARDEIQQERVTANPPSAVMIGTDGEVLCKDAWSGRYFTSNMEAIKKAQNDTNHEILNQQYASLTDFYNRLGLEPTKESDEVGWNSDKLLEVMFTTTISDNNRPVLVMDFSVVPVRNYFRAH